MTSDALTAMLEDARVSYELLPHSPTETALDEARALGIAADQIAKTLVLATPESHVRAVLPASERLELRKAADALELGRKRVHLLSEESLGRDYPEFELGAVPPFGGAHADRVLVDCRLVAHETLVLEAGAHDRSLRMRTADLIGLTKAMVADICRED